MTSRLLTLLLTLACLAPLPAAQVLDAVMRPGDRFLGALDDAEDIDVLRFHSVAGAELTLVLTAAKSDVVPHLELVDLSDDSTVVDAGPLKPGKGKVVVKKLVLPSSGAYDLLITSDDGSTGSYQFKLVEKLPKALKKIKLEQLVSSGDDLELAFDAVAGMEIDARISAGKKSAANPLAPVLDGPVGSVPLGESLQSKLKPKGDSHRLKKLGLDLGGSYTLRSENGAEEDGTLKLVFGLRRQKLPKRTLEELPSGEAEATSLSGTVLAANDDLGLANVEVVLEGLPSVTTDANGHFLIQDPPPGEVRLVIDGSAASNGPVGASFGQLEVVTQVDDEGESVLSNAVVLPDLSSNQGAQDTVDVDALSGVTTAPIEAAPVDPDSKIELAAEAGVEITVGGVPASTPVTLAVSPVPPEDVPVALAPEGLDLDASSYVSIHPTNASFRKVSLDTLAGADEGLDAVFENHRDLPVGTLVDIWAYDAELGAWVDRSAQTGVQGVVVDNGDGTTQIEVSGAVLSGGFYAPVVAVQASCATLVTGRVVAEGTDVPIEGAAVATTLGQFATTDADGVFQVRAVPAYVPGDLPACTALDDGSGRAFDLVVITPLAFGSQRFVRPVATAELSLGGTTVLGDVEAEVPTLGSLVVLVQDDGEPVVGAAVTLEGPDSTSEHVTGANGQFFVALLEPGSYIASHTFDGADEPTSVTFQVAANQTTTVNLQLTGGSGKKDVTIQVVTLTGEGAGQAIEPLPGAKVRLVTKDTAGGVQGITNANGKVLFEQVDPPYTVTAQVDRVVENDQQSIVGRFASTVFDVTPKTGVITVPLELQPADVDDQAPDAGFIGIVNNLPDAETLGLDAVLEVDVLDSVTGDSLTGFLGPGLVDPDQGFFTVDFTSTGNPVHLVFRHQEEVFFGDVEAEFSEGLVTLAALVVPDMPDPGPGGFGKLGMDYAQATPFAPVPLTVQDAPSIIDEQSWEALLVRSEGAPILLGGTQVEIVFEDEPILPEQLWLPVMDHPSLQGQQVLVQAELLQTGDEDGLDPGVGLGPFIERGGELSLRLDGLDLSGGLGLSFADDFVRILQPSANDEVDAEDTDELTAVLDDRTGNGVQGYNRLSFRGENLPEDFPVQFVRWAVHSELGEDTVPLPPTTLAMFDLFGDFEIELETLTTTGSPLSFERLFDEDFEDHLRELLAPVVPVRVDHISQLFEVLED